MSFYTYLNYNKNDYIVNLDDIWKWLDFKYKKNAKSLLEINFKNNIDYILVEDENIKNKKGGQNKEIFMLKIKTFKLLCMKAGTKKANL